MSDVVVVAPLSQGAGYGVVIGLGALFALGMIGITTTLRRRGNVEDAEEFTGKSDPSYTLTPVAKRSIGTGLTAAAVISSWTWRYVIVFLCSPAGLCQYHSA